MQQVMLQGQSSPQEFKKCMLGDYEIEEFKEKWSAMVEKFRVEDIRWVGDIY